MAEIAVEIGCALTCQSGVTDGSVLWRNHSGENVLWLMNNNRPSSIAGARASARAWRPRYRRSNQRLVF